MDNVPVGEVLVYRASDGRAQVEVRVDRETVWLSLGQMVDLFGRDKSVISRHLKSIFESGELHKSAVVAKNATTASDGKSYQVEYYNLDAIISVGYRVNSKQGVQFRQWATGVLRDHLVKGYTLNQKRLSQQALEEARQAINLLSSTLKSNTLLTEQGRAVLDLVERYAESWRLLSAYDEGSLPKEPKRPIAPAPIPAGGVRRAIKAMSAQLTARSEAGALFGQERGDALDRILGSIEQTFGGQALYPSAQSRAAHLFYFFIKDHPFSDGNKRIGTLLFVDYLRRVGLWRSADGTPRFANNALVALALLIAESAPKQKDLMIRLILTFLEDAHP